MIFALNHWNRLICLAGLVGLTACKPVPQPQEDVRPVKFTELQSAQINQRFFVGTVQADSESTLAFRVGGKVLEKRIQAGETVKKGQVLATLEADDYILGQQAKQAQLMAMQSDAQQQKIELARVRNLREQNFVSQAQLDRQGNISKLAEGRLKQAQAEFQLSSRQRGYTELIADKDGIISFTQLEPGVLVQAGQGVMKLAASKVKGVMFDVADTDLANIKSATSFKVSLAQNPNIVYQAKFKEVTGDADPVTRTYHAKLVLEEKANDLILGQSVKIWLPATGTAQARLPLSAILDQNQQQFVWVIDPKNQTVSKQAVKVTQIDSNWAYIGSQLKPNEKVVTAGVHLLRQGQKVKLLGAEEVKHAL